MNTEKIKQLEEILGRQLSESEINRLERIKRTLAIRDDDALWDILVALEYHHDYCEKLPEKIAQITLENNSEFLKVAQKELSKTYKENSSDPHSGNPRNKEVRLIGLSVFLIVLLLYGAGSMWAGYALGTGKLLTPLTILVMPVGYVIGVLFLPASVYCGRQGILALVNGQKKLGARHSAVALFFFVTGVLLFMLSC